MERSFRRDRQRMSDDTNKEQAAPPSFSEEDISAFERVHRALYANPLSILTSKRLLEMDAYQLLRPDKPGLDPSCRRKVIHCLKKCKNLVIHQKRKRQDEELLRETELMRTRQATSKLARGDAIEEDELRTIRNVFHSIGETPRAITCDPIQRPNAPESEPPLFDTMEFTASFRSSSFESAEGQIIKDHLADPDSAVSRLVDIKRRRLEDENPAGKKSPPRDLHHSRKCYTCKHRYTTVHRFYYSLCTPCGDFNFTKRNQTRDLTGKVVLITGCRVRIGYYMTLSLLRCGAEVIGTSRFASDAIDRFKQEKDFSSFCDRLHIVSLDLRDLAMTTHFCHFVLQRFPQLFALINNAAQTIARPATHHEAVRAKEMSSITNRTNPFEQEWQSFFAANNRLVLGAPLGASRDVPLLTTESVVVPRVSAQAVAKHDSSLCMPIVALDLVSEATDERLVNSWMQNLADIHVGEASEVMLINTLAPFVLNARLKPALMNRGEGYTFPAVPTSSAKKKRFDPAIHFSGGDRRFIINVSAMEGQFNRQKTTKHPHTNMAKAALNMMTRTSASDYASVGIFMNSVDTGWVTDERPKFLREAAEKQCHYCPIDEVDAAARCLDLIYTDSAEYGKFWKDYRVVQW